jgi:hypothetical protein
MDEDLIGLRFNGYSRAKPQKVLAFQDNRPIGRHFSSVSFSLEIYLRLKDDPQSRTS